jgi:hypothetical protein
LSESRSNVAHVDHTERMSLGDAGAASAFFTTLRPWLLALSVLLIGFGFWQQRRATQCAVKGRIVGQTLLWAAAVVVLDMIMFPQEIAGFLADHLRETGK